MESPVTRRELSEELQPIERRLDALEQGDRTIIARLDALTSEVATKRDLEGWAHELDRRWDAKLEAIFARHFNVFMEHSRSWMKALFEPYIDVPERVKQLEELPPRVAKLEVKVFAPRRKRR